jgi:metal-dependent amidase/aminoacylase/carboxypeptidase family protein
MKNNASKRIRELTEELSNEKRRSNELQSDKHGKEMNIQMLKAQIDALQHQHQPTQLNSQQQHLQQFQAMQLQLQRLTEENMKLTQRLSQQQHFQQQQQQQQLASLNPMGSNDAGNMQVRVLSEQMKKLSVDNAAWEKKAEAHEGAFKQAQKEKDDLLR